MQRRRKANDKARRAIIASSAAGSTKTTSRRIEVIKVKYKAEEVQSSVMVLFRLVRYCCFETTFIVVRARRLHGNDPLTAMGPIYD